MKFPDWKLLYLGLIGAGILLAASACRNPVVFSAPVWYETEWLRGEPYDVYRYKFTPSRMREMLQLRDEGLAGPISGPYYRSL